MRKGDDALIGRSSRPFILFTLFFLPLDKITSSLIPTIESITDVHWFRGHTILESHFD